MSFSTFFPTNLPALLFVLALIGWFLSWTMRLRNVRARTEFVNLALNRLDDCVEPLQKQQLWRDRIRIGGGEIQVEPGSFFDGIVQTTFEAKKFPLPPAAIHTHFKTVFVAGCEESQLDSAELTRATVEELRSSSTTLRTEVWLMLVGGVLGTLISLSARSSGEFSRTVSLAPSLPPAMWGAVFCLCGNFLFARFKLKIEDPCFAALRRKTITLWIPKLYPTVAQRAAQWAVQTLQNAARAADAAQVIETNTMRFVASIADARKAGETFAQGMKQFSHGIDASDQALVRAQAKLAAEIEKFADSLHRWTGFEDEIRKFYGSVETQQKQLSDERKSLEQIVSLITGLTARMDAGQKESLAELQSRLDGILAPILGMENRLRALGEPFDRAANHLTEIATNLWKLNESLSREVTRRLPEK